MLNLENKKYNTSPLTLNHLGNFAGDQIPTYDQILNCVRCGMCLPHCPTYTELKMERASPRGRAALIRAVADGKLEISSGFSDQMYLCLDCRACETACPSGVRIGYLVESARSQIEQNIKINPLIRLFRHFIFNWLFLRHWRLELAALPLRLYQQIGLQNLVHKSGILYLLPKSLRFMEELAPRNLQTPFRKTIPDVVPAKDKEEARIGYFLGCMMSIMFNKTTNATVEVLTRSGCTVVTPKQIRCCGAPLMSDGYKHKAIEMMKFNIDLFENLNVDYIVTDCAACGAAIKEYEEIFEHDEMYKVKAKRFSEKAREITEFLAEWPHFQGKDMPQPSCACGGDEEECKTQKRVNETPTKETASIQEANQTNKSQSTHDKKRVIYDAPCHLCHAQKVWNQPKKLIATVSDVEMVDLPEADWCCGSAGIYNITNHAMSMKILDRKMKHIKETGADIILTANPGCMLQLEYGARKHGLNMEIKHVVELLVNGTKISKQ